MTDDAIEWRDAPGFPGYQVASNGSVRSLRKKRPVMMKFETDKDGYQRIQPVQDGRYVHIAVHLLVALAFVGPSPSDDHVVCHNDGSRDNNAAANLRWGTQAENIADKVHHGTQQVGSRHGMAKINEAQAKVVKDELRSCASLKEVSTRTGVSFHIVADISAGYTWRHV